MLNAPESTSASRRLDSLTSLRAVAAFTVFGVHFCHLSDPGTPKVFQDLFLQGGIGVSFFFVLSGFVLYWASEDRLPHTTFWRRRVARIYPAYLVAWLLGILVAVYAGVPPLHPASALASLVVMQTWVPHLDYWFAVNGVGWTLCCEAFFYALYPFVAPRLKSLPAGRRRTLMICLPLITLALGLLATQGSERLQWMMRFLPVSRLPEFLLGILLAISVKRRELPRIPLVPAALLALAAYLVAGQLRFRDLTIAVPLVPLAALIVAAAQRDLRGGRPIGGQRLVWLGTVSYSFYLIHGLALAAVAETVSRAQGSPWRISGLAANLVLMPVLLAVAVAAATALHYLIERPAEKRLRDDKRHSVSDAVTA